MPKQREEKWVKIKNKKKYCEAIHITDVVLFVADDVFSEVSNHAWMARLSLPLTTDYHENIFVPNERPSQESELLPQEGLDPTSSFSTFGKIDTSK